MLAVKAPVDCDPCVEWDPAQPPDAIHAVAFVADQLIIALPPLTTALGPTLKFTVGAEFEAATVTVVDCFAVPPGPEQVKL